MEALMKINKLLFAFLLGACLAAYAKDEVVVWPQSGPPVLRFSMSKFRETANRDHQRSYTSDMSAENMWSKTIPQATFYLYVFDKDKVRIGQSFISLTDLAPGQLTKFQTHIQASGVPASFELVAKSVPLELNPELPTKPVSVAVHSLPEGADLKVDGDAAGVTPKVIRVPPGKHFLEFAKPGFSSGSVTVEVAPQDSSSRTVRYELARSREDTVMLRDGTVLTGSVDSVSQTDVVVTVNGVKQTLDRKQVRRIIMAGDEPAGK
jgi:PEGA domain-containing protein